MHLWKSQGKMELYGEVALAFVMICFLYLWNRKPRLNLPPGPLGLPIFGHIHLISELPHHSFQKFSKKYGPLMSFRLGGLHLIVLSNADTAREVLQNQATTFGSRPQLVTTREMMYNGVSVASSPYGDHWKNMRKLCATELFTIRRVNSFTSTMKQELHQLCLEMFNNQHEVVHVRKALRAYSFNVTTRILMSKTFFGEGIAEDEAKDFVGCVDNITKMIGKVTLGDMFPSMSRFDYWDIPVIRKLHKSLDTFLGKVLAEHREKGNSLGDFVDIIESFFGSKHEEFTKATLLDMTLGGTDTTSTTLEWTLAELIHNPSEILKAQEELDKVIGKDRMVTIEDVPQLEYLNAIVRESLRLHPPLPFTLRANLSNKPPEKVLGYDLPQDAVIFLNIYAIGRDPEFWEDPDSFKPGRFVGNPINVYGNDFEYIPFGAGRRVCPGLVFGMRNVQLTLANLLHGFNWSFPNGRKECSMLEGSGLTSYMAHSLEALVTPRLERSAYDSLKTI